MKKAILICSMCLTFGLVNGTAIEADAAPTQTQSAGCRHHNHAHYNNGNYMPRAYGYRPTGRIVSSGVNYIDREIGTGKVKEVVSVNPPQVDAYYGNRYYRPCYFY